MDTATTSENSNQTIKGDVADPMLSAAVGGLFIISFGVGFGLFGVGLNGLVTPEEEGNSGSNSTTGSGKTAADYTTSIDEILSVNEEFVLLGDVDTEEVATSASDSSLVERDPAGDYTVYGPEEVDSSGQGQGQGSFGTGGSQGIAFDSNAIILFDPKRREDLESLVATRSGDGTRATDANSNLEWLVNTGGGGDLVFGGYGKGLDDDESSQSTEPSQDSSDSSLDIDGAVGLTSSLTFDGTESTTGALAVQFEEDLDQLDQEKLDQLESETGSTADEQSVDRSGKRFSATATWNGNAFENIYEDSESGG
jgi:hypothetical protein